MNQPPPFPPPPSDCKSVHVLRWTFAVFVAVLLVLPGAVYFEENWRGARAWEACRKELEARGERLDWAAFIPPEIPAARNLAAAPLFQRLLNYRADPATGRLVLKGENPAEAPIGLAKPADAALSGPEYGRRIDLDAYQRSLEGKAGDAQRPPGEAPGVSVLRALERSAPLLAEFAQAAAERPQTRFPVDWGAANPAGVPFPHFTVQQQFVQTLSLRAAAYLGAGRTEEAMRDLQLCLRICRDTGAEPALIGYLVHDTCVRIVLRPIWQGLADRQWSEAQLTSLQAELGAFPALGHLLVAFRSERAFGIKEVDFLKRQPHRWRAITALVRSEAANLGSSPSDWLFQLVPAGWYDLNNVSQARFMQEYLIAAIDPLERQVDVARLELGRREMQALRASRIQMLTNLSLPVFENVAGRGARTQALLDQAVTACALERFYQARHSYPAKLDELVPAYLDRVRADVIGGGPVHYSNTPDGRYQIYSIGLDARDDQGKVVWSGERSLDRDKGDWPWQYTPVQPEPPARAR